MPQLVPFFFLNQVFFAFFLVIATLCVVSKYILPRYIRIHFTRHSTNKL